MWQIEVRLLEVKSDTTTEQPKQTDSHRLLAADTTIVPTTLNHSDTRLVAEVSLLWFRAMITVSVKTDPKATRTEWSALYS